MSDLEAFVRQPRTRSVLTRIAEGTHQLMPCGDIRIAYSLMRRDLIRFFDGKTNDLTTSYILTDKGRNIVARILPNVLLSERNRA